MSKDTEKGNYESPEGSSFWEYVAAVSCALQIFTVGCIAGWSSPTLGILMSPNAPNPITSSEASTLASMIALGHAVAPTFTGLMADKFGRKNSLLVSGIPTIISWGLIAVTQNMTVLLVARFCGGLSVGLIFCIPQMYLGEIASAKLRGAISMVCGTMLNAGILFMFVIVPFLSVSTMASVCLGVVVVAVATAWFIPESPYFLAMVGKIDEAETALGKLRGKTNVSEELELIKMTTGEKNKASQDGTEEVKRGPGRIGALKKLFTVRGNRKAIFINMLLIAVLQFGSYITIMIYGQIIFDRMKTGVTSHICTTIIASLQLVCNILTAFVIDRVGRRPLICISGIVSGACVLVIGLYFYLMEYTTVDVTRYGILALCAVFVNVVALNFGLMPLQHVVQSEILATEIKELASCIIGVAGGVMAIIGVKSYLMIAETWGFGHSVPFIGFAANTWIITGLIMKLLPETKGKTLLEIQKDLNA